MLTLMPEGFEKEIIQIVDAESMASGYNKGMHCSKAKYKIYLHQDVFIIKKDFLKRIIKVFTENPDVGIMGVLGTNRIVYNANYWKHWSIGQCYAFNPLRGFRLYMNDDSVGKIAKAVALDGMILMTQYDIEWRDDIFHNWDFYDVSQCFEYIKKGYSVAVLREQEISCLHDCGYSKLDKYDDNREIFCNEYAQYGFSFKGGNSNKNVKEKEIYINTFFEYLDSLLNVNIEEAIRLVNGMYYVFREDNKITTLRVIFDIFEKERNVKSNISFISLGDTWRDLIDKYTRYKFMVRRVEFGLDEIANLHVEMSKGRISLEAVIEIIKHCCVDSENVIKQLQKAENVNGVLF